LLKEINKKNKGENGITHTKAIGKAKIMHKR